MANAVSLSLIGIVGIALGVSIRALRESSTVEDRQVEVSRESFAAIRLLGGAQVKDSESAKRVAELEAAFSQSIGDAETRERVVELLREWGEEDVVGLFRWWRSRDFRFLSATVRETSKFLFRKLAEEDVDFAWEIAVSLKDNASRYADLLMEISNIKTRTCTAEEYTQFLGEILSTVDTRQLSQGAVGIGSFYTFYAHGNPKEALRLLQGIQDPAERAYRSWDMSFGLEEILDGLPQGSARDGALQGLAYGAKGNGDLDMAASILGEVTNSHLRGNMAEVMAGQLLQGFDLEGFEKLDNRFDLSGNRPLAAMENALRLSNEGDFEGIARLIEEAPSSEIVFKVKETFATSLARDDLESALTWLTETGAAGLEEMTPIFQRTLSTAEASTSGGPETMIETVAKGFPDLLPHTYGMISGIENVDVAESVFDLLPVDDRERVINRWLSYHEARLTPERAARIRNRFELAAP